MNYEQADKTLIRELVNRQHGKPSIGALDASGHAKQGKDTPGVQRQLCGETGKKDNCIIGRHLLYTDNDAKNPFSCAAASDLYLPECRDQDRDRCKRVGIHEEITYRPRWKISIDQLEHTMSQGLRFDYVTYDEEYGKVPEFIYELDRLGQKAIGEVPCNFRIWGKNPQITPEQVADAANMLAWKIWRKYPYSWNRLQELCRYYQERNEASYAGRRKKAKAKSIEFL